ncbi:hypothetical protein C3497_13465 [Zoogloeaceae bacteirum Par-f-2]|nr:hypothetical protein C3497_13465 [Zoogloeaceae bacteirum Par-f-2]
MSRRPRVFIGSEFETASLRLFASLRAALSTAMQASSAQRMTTGSPTPASAESSPCIPASLAGVPGSPLRAGIIRRTGVVSSAAAHPPVNR